jgi:hypothetical protein
MSATKTLIDFPAKAREVLDALETSKASLATAERLTGELAAAARTDNNGGLPRLGFAVMSEAESFQSLMRDCGLDEDSLDSWIGDARDLVALIDLAVAEREAVPS